MPSQSAAALPSQVKQALKKLGSDINEARRRHQISTMVMSKKAKISRPTLTRIEQGDAGVCVGNYASVLFVLGMANRVADIADVVHDRVGLEIDRKALPKRIHSPKPQRARKRDG